MDSFCKKKKTQTHKHTKGFGSNKPTNEWNGWITAGWRQIVCTAARTTANRFLAASSPGLPDAFVCVCLCACVRDSITDNKDRGKTNAKNAIRDGSRGNTDRNPIRRRIGSNECHRRKHPARARPCFVGLRTTRSEPDNFSLFRERNLVHTIHTSFPLIHLQRQ
mmetsp:Transcript_19826/g.41010  ORF Transcript_19826/g.41010 Transcript_19826/m.41010 type:complete len:164 (-) Transcript_19826:1426-1917(-)